MAQEFKVKGVSSTEELADGAMKQVELEGIEGGKALLLKFGGKVHATSANCTHYGAPLEKGVLSPDGFLTCPWHGACFKVDSGDIENAPAPDPLSKYEVVEKSGAVYIKGEESTIKANKRQTKYRCKASGKEGVVVIGGGSGAFGFVEAYRENGGTAPVTVISKEGHLPIDRTKLSKALIPDAGKLALRSQDWYDAASVQYVADEATSVDFARKSVSTASGKSYPYTKLILATGGTPKQLPLPGFKDLKNIFTVRTPADVQQILAAVGESKGKNIVVIGSSFIGMEVGNALAKENSVTVVGMESTPLERVMGAQVGAIFQRNLEKAGVTFHLSAGVDRATPSSSAPSAVGAVHLKDGTALPADLVVLGIGVGPATEIFHQPNCPLPFEKDGSLRTDASFAVQHLPDVYAIGDIASFPYHGPGGNGRLVRIEHWNVAQNAGRLVGAALADPSNKPNLKDPFFIPVFWSALGAQLRYAGNTMASGYDDLVLHQPDGPHENKFVAYYTHGDTVVAVASMGVDPVVSKCADLMRRGKMPGKESIRGGVEVLEVV